MLKKKLSCGARKGAIATRPPIPSGTSRNLQEEEEVWEPEMETIEYGGGNGWDSSLSYSLTPLNVLVALLLLMIGA